VLAADVLVFISGGTGSGGHKGDDPQKNMTINNDNFSIIATDITLEVGSDMDNKEKP